MPSYFSDRHRAPRPRTNETVEAPVWGGIFAIVSAHLSDGSFGYKFPDTCPDGYGIIGNDVRAMGLLLKAEIPEMPFPLPSEPPDTLTILDFLEFVAASIGRPIEGQYHSFFRRHHLSFNREEGLQEFVESINSIFARNGVACELTEEGQVRRTLTTEMQQLISGTLFHSGDGETDRLLEEARSQFSSPRAEARRDALEKVWDAFERIKTLRQGQARTGNRSA
jgi:hypothetical protein